MTQPLFVRQDDGRVFVTPDVIYPHYFRVLGLAGEVTQGQLETVRNAFTQDLMEVLGPPLHLVIVPDKKWRLSTFPVGEAPKAAVGSWYKSLPGTPASRLGIV
jgi:hypothetical protein